MRSMSFDFTFSHFWLRFFDDFHYQALLGPILEGKSDQTKSAILQSQETSNKKLRNQTHFKFNFTLIITCRVTIWQLEWFSSFFTEPSWTCSSCRWWWVGWQVRRTTSTWWSGSSPAVWSSSSDIFLRVGGVILRTRTSTIDLRNTVNAIISNSPRLYIWRFGHIFPR